MIKVTIHISENIENFNMEKFHEFFDSLYEYKRVMEIEEVRSRFTHEADVEEFDE